MTARPLDHGRELVDAAIGKRIESARLFNEGGDYHALLLTFFDGTTLALADAAQLCCERRWMTCDDDLASFTGSKLHSVEVRRVEANDTSDNPHDVAFLHVTMEDGNVIVCTTHNEHNGYYGGFSLQARVFA